MSYDQFETYIFETYLLSLEEAWGKKTAVVRLHNFWGNDSLTAGPLTLHISGVRREPFV